MRIRHLLLAVLLTAPANFVLSAEPHHPPQEETELEDKMDLMGTAFRKLKRSVNDATQNPASLQLVAAMRTAAAEAEKHVPAQTADVPVAERAKFVADYRVKMKDLLTTLEKLEVALRADKNDEAARLVAELSVMQKVGHKTFKRPDEKR
jgi:soluble cytochrome b562